MNATFYVNTAPVKKVDKRGSLTSVATRNNLHVLEPFNVHDGRLVLAYDADIAKCNYVLADDIYYFVETPILNTGQQLVLKLTKDVLMTNLAEIMELDVIVGRSSTEYNSYIYDGRQKGQVNQLIETLFFNAGDSVLSPSGRTFIYNDNNIVVVAIGGEGT